jgi:hypothetical protein
VFISPLFLQIAKGRGWVINLFNQQYNAVQYSVQFVSAEQNFDKDLLAYSKHSMCGHIGLSESIDKIALLTTFIT